MTTERMILNVEARDGGAKGPSRRLRGAGMIPGVLYGKGIETTNIAVDPKSLEAVLRTEFGFNNVFQVTVGDRTHLCMLKARQFHPVRRVITHIDLFVVDPEMEVEVRVPLRTEGRSLGERQGGRLEIVTREVLVRCKVRDLPPFVSHDVTNVALSQAVYCDEMTPPAGVTLVYKNRFPIIRIARKRGAKAEADA